MFIVGHDVADERRRHEIDSARHSLIVGKSGVGKSNLLIHLALQIAEAGHGLVLNDPHGQLVQDFLARLTCRRNDVVVIDPSDPRCPGLNIFADAPPHLAIDAAWAFIKANWQQYNAPQSEDIFRMVMRALFDYVAVPTFILARQVLIDKGFRKHVVSHVKDQEVRDYFEKIYDGEWDVRMRTEKTAPILNKLNSFVDDIFYPIFAQPESFNFRQAIDRNLIVVVNLSKERIGSERAEFIGQVVGFKHQQALLSRQDILDSRPYRKAVEEEDWEEVDRLLPKSYAIWDEFLNFRAMDISVYLAESRKYGGRLILSTQTIFPFPDITQEILLGNVSSFIIFRTGRNDAALFASEFGNDFPPTAIQWTKDYEAHLMAVIDGIPMTKPAHFRTYPPGNEDPSQPQRIIRRSQNNFGRKLDVPREGVNQCPANS